GLCDHVVWPSQYTPAKRSASGGTRSRSNTTDTFGHFKGALAPCLRLSAGAGAPSGIGARVLSLRLDVLGEIVSQSCAVALTRGSARRTTCASAWLLKAEQL